MPGSTDARLATHNGRRASLLLDLHEVLADAHGMQLFQSHVQSEFSSENLRFYQVQHFCAVWLPGRTLSLGFCLAQVVSRFLHLNGLAKLPQPVSAHAFSAHTSRVVHNDRTHPETFR